MDQRPEAHAGAGLLAFEIDCGEGWTGHRLVATGLRLDGTSDDPVHADYSEHHDGKPVHPMVSVTYRVTPALRTSMLAGREVYAQVRLAPAADRAHWPAVLEPGEERDCTPGAGVTHGAFGPFVLPDGTREVRISLTNVAVTTDGVPPADDSPSRPLGSLVIDLSSAAAHWEPS